MVPAALLQHDPRLGRDPGARHLPDHAPGCGPRSSPSGRSALGVGPEQAHVPGRDASAGHRRRHRVLRGAAPLADHEGRSPDPERTAQYLTRWTCDLARGGGSFEERILWGGMHSDFPEVDRRVLTQAYRHGFMIAKDRSRPVNPEVAVGLSYNTIAHIDHLTGEVETYYVGEDAAVQEPVFVPRSLDAPEGDGYLLTVINRFPQARGEMVVFDTARLAAGPVATVRVPLFLRPVFHSTWVPMAELP